MRFANAMLLLSALPIVLVRLVGGGGGGGGRGIIYTSPPAGLFPSLLKSLNRLEKSPNSVVSLLHVFFKLHSMGESYEKKKLCIGKNKTKYSNLH